MLPVTILIPTRNSMQLLPAHLESARDLIEAAEEVVVVDSDSADGTFEHLAERTPKSRTRLLRHPPGLYQSWNFGIQSARSEFVYVSTVGDTMTLAGLRSMQSVASRHGADIVITPPSIVGENGQATGQRWPIHRLIERMQLTGPRIMDGLEAFVHAISFLPDALLGSSASNLYRTAFMRERPFPTDFGTVGDGAWAVRHALEARVALIPQSFSTFLLHEKAYSIDEYKVADANVRMIDLADEGLRSADDSGAAATWPAGVRASVEGLVMLQRKLLTLQQELIRFRGGKLPWIMHPRAWRVRSERNEERRNLEALAAEILRKINQTKPRP